MTRQARRDAGQLVAKELGDARLFARPQRAIDRQRISHDFAPAMLGRFHSVGSSTVILVDLRKSIEHAVRQFVQKSWRAGLDRMRVARAFPLLRCEPEQRFAPYFERYAQIRKQARRPGARRQDQPPGGERSAVR
jgi:hypothetical protein